MFFLNNTDIGKVFGVQLITSDAMKGAVQLWDSVSTGSPPPRFLKMNGFQCGLKSPQP